MRIAINGMLLGRRLSGVELSILNLVRGLAESDRHEYRLFVSSCFSGRLPETEKLRIRRTRASARYRLVRLLWEQSRLAPAAAAQGCELLHAPGYLAPLHCALPVVLTVYDLMALRFPRWCRAANVVNYRFFLPRSIRRAAGILVPSEWTAREVRDRFRLPPERLRVVPLGVGPEFRQRDDRSEFERVRARFGLTSPYLLCVGRQEPRKNLAALVRAFHDLRLNDACRAMLAIVGPSGRATQELRRMVAGMGLRNEVVMTGFVRREELVALYSGAEMLVHPSLYEGFGLPLLEAMACGLPVLCSNRGALPEVAGGAARLVDPQRGDELATAMSGLMADSSARAELRARGLRRAARFTWRRHAEETERFYEDVAAAKARRGS